MWQDEWLRVERFTLDAKATLDCTLETRDGIKEKSRGFDTLHAVYGGPGKVFRWRGVAKDFQGEDYDVDWLIYLLAEATVRSQFKWWERTDKGQLKELTSQERDYSEKPSLTLTRTEGSSLPRGVSLGILDRLDLREAMSATPTIIINLLEPSWMGCLIVLPDPEWRGRVRNVGAHCDRPNLADMLPPLANTTGPQRLSESRSLPNGAEFSWTLEPHTSDLVVEFWINAFIPGNVAGAKRVPGDGEHAGKRMISGPPLSDCFLTDSRSFSNDPEAPSRIQLFLTFDLSADKSSYRRSVGTTFEIDCETGETVGTGRATTSGIRVKQLVTTLPGKKWQRDFTIAASDPLVFLAAVGGDVDATGTVAIERRTNEVILNFSGLVDAFPAFEAYARLRDGGRTGDVVTVFQQPPAPEAGPFSLIGFANKPVKRRVKLPIP